MTSVDGTHRCSTYYSQDVLLSLVLQLQSNSTVVLLACSTGVMIMRFIQGATNITYTHSSPLCVAEELRCICRRKKE